MELRKKKSFRPIELDPNDYSAPIDVYFIPRLRRIIEENMFTDDEQQNTHLAELAKIVGSKTDYFMFDSAVSSRYEDMYNFLLDFRIKWVDDVTRNIELVKKLVNWVNYDEFEVRKSNIPGAGDGLFTKVAYKKGTNFAIYGGIHMSDNVYDYGGPKANAYIVSVGSDAYPHAEGLTVDGFRCFRLAEPGRWANSFKEARLNNAEFQVRWFQQRRIFEVWLVATKDIAAGEEIYVTYGDTYDWTFAYAACTQCEAPVAPYMCGKCKQVRYCDAKCQELHWKDHKTKCIGF